MKPTQPDNDRPIDARLLKALGLTAGGLRRQRPVYRALARALEDAIARGALAHGSQLPPERLLANALRVSRTTVVSAYQELESRGLVRGYVGRGTFVSAAPEPDGAPFAWRGKVATPMLRSREMLLRDLVRQATDPRLVSIAAGVPALDLFPSEAFGRAVERTLRHHGAAVWGHGLTEGHPELRERIAQRWGGHADRVLVLAGAQQGLDLLARCLIDPGDVVIVDRPGYLGAIHTFREAGARLHGWDVMHSDLDELEDLLMRHRPKLIYTNPTFQNPTGWTMPLKTRREFLALARRYRVPIVEDDTYRELSFSGPPPPSLYSLDDQSIVIYLNSFSKMLAPGLRLGWIAAAEPIVEHLAQIKQRADPQTQNLVQFVVDELFDDGTFEHHLAAVRAEHRRRSHTVAAAFTKHIARDALKMAVPPEGGLYFWCRLRDGMTARAVLERALNSHVAFVPGDAFYPDPAGAHDLRICFASIAPAKADEFAQRLAMSIGAPRVIAGERSQPA